jgi:hypothetical protein
LCCCPTLMVPTLYLRKYPLKLVANTSCSRPAEHTCVGETGLEKSWDGDRGVIALPSGDRVGTPVAPPGMLGESVPVSESNGTGEASVLFGLG